MDGSIKVGIPFAVFRRGVVELASEGHQFVSYIYNFVKSSDESFLSWPDFLRAMTIVQVKDMSIKIKTFTDIIDDGSGCLEREKARQIA